MKIILTPDDIVELDQTRRNRRRYVLQCIFWGVVVGSLLYSTYVIVGLEAMRQ